MKIIFTDSFGKSLKRLIWHQSYIYKTYSLFRTDIPHFFANIWRFKKVLWNHSWWDYTFTLEAFQTSISIMERNFNKSHETHVSRDKKIIKMQRVLELLKNHSEDNYMDRAEEVLGKLPHHPFEFEDAGNGNSRLVDNDTQEEKDQWKKVYDYSILIEESEWNELWDIIKGQKKSDFDIYFKLHSNEYTQEEIDNGDVYDKWKDGSDIRGWWD